MDRYLNYLRAKLRGKVAFTATQDIIAHPEGIMAKVGSSIDQKAYLHYSRLNLNQTLESCIEVSDQLDQRSIYHHIYQVIEQDTSFSAIDEQFGVSSVLEQCCEKLKQFPVLLEILTILKIDMEELFEQSLLSAYFAYVTSVIAKFPQEKIESAFLAGLFHDIGLLFINRQLTLDKTRKLSAKEWHEMQLHPIVAYKLLRSIENFPKATCRAIVEHHERPDGSGYPLSKTEENISELGSLINLLDDVVVIHQKRFHPLKRSIKGLLPVIQMNTFGYRASAVSAVIQALKHAPELAVEDIDKDLVKKLMEYTYNQQLYINKIIDVMKEVDGLIGPNHNKKSITAIQNMGAKIISVIASSGLQESSYVELLQRLKTEDHKVLHLEIEQVRLMLEEAIYQLHGYQKAVNGYCDNHSDDLAEKLAIFLEIFSASIRPPIPEEIVQYWEQLAS